MADPLDLREWQLGLDAGLVRRLQRPLRRSAAVGCAWAGEALARGQLGTLPLFVGWMARWGMNEATIAELRPVVHALGPEAAGRDLAQRASAAPPLATASGRRVTATRSPVVAVARNVPAPGEGTSGGRTGTRVVAEVLATRASDAPGGGARAERGSPTLDLRVDPALRVAPPAMTPRAAPPIAVTRPGRELDLPPRPRARPQEVTPMDLARAQAGQVAQGHVGPGREPDAARREFVAAAARVAAPATHTSSSTPTPAARSEAPPRVRARVVAAQVESVLRDSHERVAAARPRVSVATPTPLSTPSLTGLAPPGPGVPGIDVALPGAAVRQAPAAPAVAVAAASPPALPSLAPVATSQLDIPAIAQAVHRHLERELRWERERRGGRP